MPKSRTTKTRKTNGKAPSPSVKTFDIGLVPFPAAEAERPIRLTRRLAMEFLRDTVPALQDIVCEGLNHASSDEESDALNQFSCNVREALEACAAAMSGERVNVCTQVPTGEKIIFGDSWSVVAALSHIVAAALRSDNVREDDLKILEMIVSAVGRCCGDAERRERALYMIENQLERKARDPNTHSEALDAQIKEIKAQRDARLDRLRELAVGELDQEIARLTYEYSLHGHKVWGYQHPGKPPKGYKPSADANGAQGVA